MKLRLRHKQRNVNNDELRSGDDDTIEVGDLKNIPDYNINIEIKNKKKQQICTINSQFKLKLINCEFIINKLIN